MAAGQKIRIKLRAYHHEIIDQSARKIVDTVNRTGASVHGPIPLPTRIEKFAVIRSPFKDKDSREHFEYPQEDHRHHRPHTEDRGFADAA